MNCDTPLHYRAGRTVSRVTVRATRIIDCAPTLARRDTTSRRAAALNVGIEIAVPRCDSIATKHARLDRPERCA